MRKNILVTGAGGLIGSRFVKYLADFDCHIRGVDLKNPEFSPTMADEFEILDLRRKEDCYKALIGIDEIYHFAAQMGGMGYISQEHLSSFNDSNLINTNIAMVAADLGVKKIFFSSSACVYPLFKQNTDQITIVNEEDAIPAQPNEAYGWEKLFAELRFLEYQAQGKYEVRIARFENCYGPESTFEGGREKAPAALCRKVALAKDGDEIQVWGDGNQKRSFMYVDDCVRGIYRLMQSEYPTPINMGSDEIVTINELAKLIIEISGKKLSIKNVSGPEGVRTRVIDHDQILKTLGWRAEVSLKEGIRKTYDWISSQV